MGEKAVLFCFWEATQLLESWLPVASWKGLDPGFSLQASVYLWVGMRLKQACMCVVGMALRHTDTEKLAFKISGFPFCFSQEAVCESAKPPKTKRNVTPSVFLLQQIK